MMGIINMAHGEFIMCGVYVTCSRRSRRAAAAGPCSCGALSPGWSARRSSALIIRRLYHRPLDSICRDLGHQPDGDPRHAGVLGSSSRASARRSAASSRRLFLLDVPPGAIRCRLGVLAGLYLLFVRTRFGVIARATMQNADMAQALGVKDSSRIYAISFGMGAGAGRAVRRAVRADDDARCRRWASFIVESFVTVVVGGANVLLGTAPAAVLLAFMRSALQRLVRPIVGQIGLLITVIIVIRVLPEGYRGWLCVASVR